MKSLQIKYSQVVLLIISCLVIYNPIFAQNKRKLSPEEKFELAAQQRRLMFEKGDSVRAARAKKSDSVYKKLKRNTLAIYPFSTTNTSGAPLRNYNVGLSYERSLTKYLSVKIPILIAPQTLFTDFSIQLKFFPKMQGKVKYAAGCSYYYGTGKIIYRDQYIPGPLTTGYRVYSGLMLINSLNISLKNNLFFGGEIGLGNSFYDYITLWNGEIDLSSNTLEIATSHIAICVGYRF